tara:strand:+ start:408 stop:1208 length:801 start_codon:yes stop_codon:yes gene_type:complete
MVMVLNIKKIVFSGAFEKFITAIILINCFLIGVETYLVNDLISSIQIICLVVFIIEIFLRYTASNSNREYFSEGWNIFDITIVLICLVPESLFENSAIASSFRVLRVFRVLRLLKANPEVRLITAVLLKSIKTLYYNGIVFLIFCYLFTLVGVEMFRLPENISDSQIHQIEEVTALGDRSDPFGTVLDGADTLFSITLGYEWWQTRNTLLKSSELNLIDASPLAISIYLYLWYATAIFLLLNLVVGAIINNYQTIIDEIKSKETKK